MEISSTIFWVFVMTQPWIEPQSPGPLANESPTGQRVDSLKMENLNSDQICYTFFCLCFMASRAL